jgi:hypothetical protein
MSGIPPQYVPVQMMTGTGITDTPSSIHPAAWGFLAVSVLALLLVIYMVYIDRPKSAPTPAGPLPAPPAATATTYMPPPKVNIVLSVKESDIPKNKYDLLIAEWQKLLQGLNESKMDFVVPHIIIKKGGPNDTISPGSREYLDKLEDLIDNDSNSSADLKSFYRANGFVLIKETGGNISIYKDPEISRRAMLQFVMSK